NHNLTVGQTVSRVLTGEDLYFPSTDPWSKYYFLDFPFRIDGATGIYRFKISVRTRCGTIERETTISRGITNSAVNAGTDIALPCNSTSTQLAGSQIDGRGLWSTVKSPTGAIDPINGTNQQLRNPNLTGLISGT